MKKWQDIVIKIILLLVGKIILWGIWVTNTLYEVKSDIKLLLLKSQLTIADAEIKIPKENGPALKADMGLPLHRLFGLGGSSKKESEHGNEKTLGK